MILARFDPDRPALVVEGHACADVPGRDLVCAGASLLVFALARRLRSIALPGELLQDDLEKGRAVLVTRPRPENRVEFLAAFRVAEEGFRLLADNHPRYARFECGEITPTKGDNHV